MTPHNSAKLGEISKIVILFGDPTQAHHLAYKYLTNIKKVSDVRYACFYTGDYKGKTYTFGTSGMGSASAAIYIYELYDVYKVEKIIRAGTTSSYLPQYTLRDTVIVKEAYSETKLWDELFHEGVHTEVLEPTKSLHEKLKESANKLGYKIPEVRAHSLDIFYFTQKSYKQMQKRSQADVVEMEAYILFFHAKLLNKEAACLLTVVNNLYEKDSWLTIDEQVDARCPSVETILNADL